MPYTGLRKQEQSETEWGISASDLCWWCYMANASDANNGSDIDVHSRQNHVYVDVS